MRKPIVLLAATIAGLSLATGSAARGDGIAVWPVDPHVKVFRDLEPPETSGPITLRAARNEYEPAQIAIRAKEPVEGVSVNLTPLVHVDGKATMGPEAITSNFVGFIPLVKNTPDSTASSPCSKKPARPTGSRSPTWATLEKADGAARRSCSAESRPPTARAASR